MRSLLTILKNIMTKIKNNETAINKKVEIVKLWENASPGSTFGGQDITLNLNGYYEIEVEFRPFSANTAQTKKEKCKVGSSGAVLDMVMSNAGYAAGSTAFSGWRSVIATTSKVTFSGGKNHAGDDNRICVPVTIYGIKGVQ